MTSLPLAGCRAPFFFRRSHITSTPWVKPSISSTRVGLPRHFHASPDHRAQEQDHYAVLGVKRSASRREIKERFYELSKQYHPDAPSTSSSSVSPEDRLAHFQSISASYATLSDDSLRRSYDANLGASAHGRRPRYARGHSGFSSSGVGGAADSRPWSDGENERRRERANYAWAHPSSSTRRSAGADARNRSDPFAGTSNGGRGAAGVGGHSESLFRAFAAREAFARDRAAGGMGAGASASATSAFGDKAEEESRLINDSSTKRTGQVFLMFFGAFALASMLSGSKDRAVADKNDGRRR